MSRLPVYTVDAQQPELRQLARVNDIEARLSSIENDGVQLVSALPSSPLDGQEIMFQTAAMRTNGELWTFRYRESANTYKWEYKGGQPIRNEVVNSEATASSTYTNLTTVGPSLTLPLNGLWEISWGCNIEGVLLAGWRGRCAYKNLDNAAVWAAGGGSSSISYGASVSRTRLDTFTTGSVTLLYRSDAANSVTFSQRWVAARPIAVG